MDDTQTPDLADTNAAPTVAGQTPSDLAALDPADAPTAAEAYAAQLASELEAAGAEPGEPVQLQAQLDDATDPEAP